MLLVFISSFECHTFHWLFGRCGDLVFEVECCRTQLQPMSLRKRLQDEFLNIIKNRPRTKIQFYPLHVNHMLVYCKLDYLLAGISAFFVMLLLDT